MVGTGFRLGAAITSTDTVSSVDWLQCLVVQEMILLLAHGQYLETCRTQMSRYLIVIESTPTGFSAYSPDLPGCVSTGETRDDVERNMREAIEFHVDGMREEGLPVPEPRSDAAFCEIGSQSGSGRSNGIAPATPPTPPDVRFSASGG